MSLLAGAKPSKVNGKIITIVGAAGTGKTSLAMTFPKPFLIRTQGEGTPVDAKGYADDLGVTETSKFLFEQMRALMDEEHDYKTLVIDTITGLELMFIKEVVDSDPKARGIAQSLGGFGAGRDAVAAMQSRVRKGANILMERKGMNIVFLAHTDIDRIDLPDAEAFNQYSLRLHSKSLPYYVDSVDLVGFLKQETIVKESENGSRKAITTGSRVLVCHLTPSSVAKNRLGVTEELEVIQGENPLAPFMQMGPTNKNQPKKEVA